MNIYWGILLCVCLSACNKQSHPNTPEVVEQAIRMFPTSVASTRALISETEDLRKEGFIVYGYKQTPTTGAQVFDHQEVTYDGIWEYSPTRYWDIAASYHFGAYSPQSIAAAHNGTGKGTHTLTIEAPYWQVADGDETDIVVATSHDTAENYLALGNGTVDLHFEHILSLLEIQFVHDPLLMNEYRLHRVAYKNVPIVDATSTYTLDYTTPTNSAMSTIEMLETADSIKITDTDEGIAVMTEVTEAATCKHLVVPFGTNSPTGIQITILYSVNGANRYGVVNTNLQRLEAGKRYVLKLVFNSGATIIPTIYIGDWIDEDVDENDKYNW